MRYTIRCVTCCIQFNHMDTHTWTWYSGIPISRTYFSQNDWFTHWSFFHKTEALFNICLSYIYVHVLHSALCIYILYWYKNQNKIKRLANQQGHANHLQDIGGDWSRAGLQPVLDLLRDAVKQGAFTPDPLIPLQIEPSPEIFDRMKTQWLQTQSKWVWGLEVQCLITWACVQKGVVKLRPPQENVLLPFKWILKSTCCLQSTHGKTIKCFDCCFNIDVVDEAVCDQFIGHTRRQLHKQIEKKKL